MDSTNPSLNHSQYNHRIPDFVYEEDNEMQCILRSFFKPDKKLELFATLVNRLKSSLRNPEAFEEWLYEQNFVLGFEDVNKPPLDLEELFCPIRKPEKATNLNDIRTVIFESKTNYGGGKDGNNYNLIDTALKVSVYNHKLAELFVDFCKGVNVQAYDRQTTGFNKRAFESYKKCMRFYFNLYTPIDTESAYSKFVLDMTKCTVGYANPYEIILFVKGTIGVVMLVSEKTPITMLALANGLFDQSDKHPIVCYTIGKVSYSSEFCINLLDYILPQSIQIMDTKFES
ncbi:hypothetical protein WR25_04690 [Diploscapter pachys]|uniref:Uncharacterized protein n=1 Tax=Diploscapter pachys TaxID=2018661 RepID=A0A2A2J6D9_9BILA|nr:hypothetical protein WR25_04690 [Diploscapter pachys]